MAPLSIFWGLLVNPACDPFEAMEFLMPKLILMFKLEVGDDGWLIASLSV